MVAPSVGRHDKNMVRKWLETKRGTHWTIAGSVAVVIFGGYFIYNTLESIPTTTNPTPAAKRTLDPMTPAPLPLKR